MLTSFGSLCEKAGWGFLAQSINLSWWLILEVLKGVLTCSRSRGVGAGGPRGHPPVPILADQIALFQLGGADYGHHITIFSLDFQTFLRP